MKFKVLKIGISKRKTCNFKNKVPTKGIAVNKPIKMLYARLIIAYKIDKTKDCIKLHVKYPLIGFLTTKTLIKNQIMPTVPRVKYDPAAIILSKKGTSVLCCIIYFSFNKFT